MTNHDRVEALSPRLALGDQGPGRCSKCNRLRNHWICHFQVESGSVWHRNQDPNFHCLPPTWLNSTARDNTSELYYPDLVQSL